MQIRFPPALVLVLALAPNLRLRLRLRLRLDLWVAAGASACSTWPGNVVAAAVAVSSSRLRPQASAVD